jgi:hypothetical protein
MIEASNPTRNKISGLFPPGYRKSRRSSIDSQTSNASDSSSGSDGSCSSNVSWGSTIVAVGCDCISHNDDEVEVAEWLLYSKEQDWAVRPPVPASSSQTTKSSPPFTLSSTPGPLFLQIVFAILAYWRLIPNHPIQAPPPQPRPSTSGPPPPLKKYKPSGRAIFVDPYIRPNGTRMMFDKSEAYYNKDDIEYLVPPTPGTNEEVLRIPVTNDFSKENVVTHTRDMLRIYRVPLDEMTTFGPTVRSFGFVGHVVRKPYDSFDTIQVIRQGHVSWDLGPKDERWMLIGRDGMEIQRILMRCDPRMPPFSTRLKHLFLKAAYKIVAPWVPTWILY